MDQRQNKTVNPLNAFKKLWFFGLLFILAIGVTWALSGPIKSFLTPVPAPLSAIATEGIPVTSEPIQPIPLHIELDEDKVALGHQLFHDNRLSSNLTVSCATCHPLDQAGTDHLPISKGMGGSLTGLNSPTVFNSGFHSRLNWNGRSKTLEEQANGPIASVDEMGGLPWDAVIKRLSQSDEYRTTFQAIYGDGITANNVRDAIATFQRSLYTPNAPFDQYLRGNKDAISEDAKQGYSLFKSYGCIACHQGIAVGGNMFQTLGIFGDYFSDRGTPELEADLGRYTVTGNELDRHVFKVPSLRNITLTSPYLHDGNAATLDKAIKIMGRYQLGVDIPQQDVDQIMSFLRSLTGEYQGEPL
ncbi:MAG: c-type cytochrome [Merismopedia sp. SIO2A8]|nr:c-type cytochrome [Merismopedia sp. SIO2A8]